MNRFTPELGILSAEQKALWPRLEPVRSLGYVLHGGTAVALRLGHRKSEDFDFFTERPLDRNTLFRALPSLRRAVVLQDREETYVALLNGIKVSFFGHIDFGRVGEPDLTLDDVAVVASLRDLLAQKLKVVMQRLESKDYRDIAAILSSGETLSEGMGSASALFGVTFAPAECSKALVFFKGGDLDRVPSADKSVLLEAVRQLDWRRIPLVPRLGLALQGN